jgi:acyl-CoA thioester hydrolase
MAKTTPETRAAFRHFRTITTRWMDNDVYRHVNNVVYYSFFDTAVNQYLLEQGVLDIAESPEVGLVVETQCSYFASLAFPDLVHAGLRVTRIGGSSVRYGVGLFRNDDATACAQGRFVHVYVDRATQRPVSVPEAVRTALLPLVVEAG